MWWRKPQEWRNYCQDLKILKTPRLAEYKKEKSEPDVSMRVGLALNDWRFLYYIYHNIYILYLLYWLHWSFYFSSKILPLFSPHLKRPHTPLEKALEFHYFDFEFADEPSDTSLKQNVDVFQVDESRPDMWPELRNVLRWYYRETPLYGQIWHCWYSNWPK